MKLALHRDPERDAGSDRREETIDKGNKWLWAAVVLTAALSLLLVRPLLLPPDRIATVPYPTLKRELAAGNVLTIAFDERDIRGTFREPVDAPHDGEARSVLEFTATLPGAGDPELRELVRTSGAEVTGRPGESGTPAGWPALPVLAFLTVVLLIILLWESRRRQTRP